MKELRINHLAVFVIVVLGQVLPMFWYGIFADTWMRLNGLTEQQVMENQSAVPYVVSVFASLIMAYTLAVLFVKMRIESATQGMATGALIGFAFMLLPYMVINVFEMRPYELSWLNGGLNVIVISIAGLILGAWRKYRTL